MARLALAVLITIVIVVFSISNSHHVDLCCAVGPPIKIRLIFLLMSTLLVGMAVPIFYGMLHRMKRREQMKRENELQQAIQQVDRDILG
jgi:uncharacterized integral membrane protein